MQYIKKNWKVALVVAFIALGSVWYYFAIANKIETPAEPTKDTWDTTEDWGTLEEVFGREIPQDFVDKDCSDFERQKEAQAFYERGGGLSGGDPHRLDANKDGKACESLR